MRILVPVHDLIFFDEYLTIAATKSSKMKKEEKRKELTLNVKTLRKVEGRMLSKERVVMINRIGRQYVS